MFQDLIQVSQSQTRLLRLYCLYVISNKIMCSIGVNLSVM